MKSMRLLPVVACIASSAVHADPDIHITSIPEYGGTSFLQGKVEGVADYSAVGVATYIQIEGVGWWSKPFFTSPTVPVNPDGSFSVPVVTGGLDNRATIYSTALVPAGYSPPLVGGAGSLPAVPAALASDTKTRYSRTVSFAGYDWGIKESPVGVGPGGNSFSNSPSDVWVDAGGRLHLTLSNHDGRWWATEAIGSRPLGYGTYIIQTASPLNLLDRSATFGAFTWDPFGGGGAVSPNRELDVEDSRWGDAGAATDSQFVVQPFDLPSHRVRYALPDLGAASALTRIIDWQPTGVRFVAVRGHVVPGQYSAADVIAEWSYAGSDVPQPGQATPRFNLWANTVELGGVGPPAPSSGLPQEVIVSDFIFQPVPEPESWLLWLSGAAVVPWLVRVRSRARVVGPRR